MPGIEGTKWRMSMIVRRRDLERSAADTGENLADRLGNYESSRSNTVVNL